MYTDEQKIEIEKMKAQKEDKPKQETAKAS